jgi:hypothetical protein
MCLPAEHPARQGINPVQQADVVLEQPLVFQMHFLKGRGRALVGVSEILQGFIIVLRLE